MRTPLAALLLVLASSLANPVLAGSITREGVSKDLAAQRAMQAIPENAGTAMTNCMGAGLTTRYRCTSTWSK